MLGELGYAKPLPVLWQLQLLPKRPVGTPGMCQLLGGVREAGWGRGRAQASWKVSGPPWEEAGGQGSMGG